MAMKNLHGSELEKAVAKFSEEYNLERIKSYDPPEGFQPMDKHGNIIKENWGNGSEKEIV
jgi:hypothetical protein